MSRGPSRKAAAESSTAETSEEPKQKHPRNTLNELTGEKWLYFTRSVLRTSYPREFGHNKRKAHGANKPPRLMQSLIEFFTQADGRVLDPFAGVGGTLLGASLAEPPRACTGIEINPDWAAIYEEVASDHPDLREQEMVLGDCRELLADEDRFPDGCVDFVATDPPYNIHFERTMCDGKYDESHANRRSDYDMRSDADADVANLGSFDDYLDAMEDVFRGCHRVLKPGGYLAFIVRNAYQDGEYLFTHVDLARRAKAAGLQPKGEIVWYQTGSRLRPYGYPSAYVPNIAHQFIVILRKPKKARSRKRA
ncbi:MAG: DNA methyltransferase [Planctomycetota bacterium]